MVRVKKEKKRKKKDKILDEKVSKWHHELERDTKHSIFAIIFFAISVLFILAGVGKAGLMGSFLFSIFDKVFGSGFFLIPTVFLLLGVSFLASYKPHVLATNLIGGSMFLISSLSLAELLFGNKTGGYIGYFVTLPVVKFFDTIVSFVIFGAFLFISILMIFNTSFRIRKNKIVEDVKKEGELDVANEELKEKEIDNTGEKKKSFFQSIKNKIPQKPKESVKEDAQKEIETEMEEKFQKDNMLDDSIVNQQKIKIKKDQNLPPADLLEGDKGKSNSGDIKANTNIIKRTLLNFGIDVEMGEVSIGPAVTQYTLKPAEGIKLAKIVALQNDLSLALASHPLRIEAPIPGKSLLGIEIPNKTKSIVGLKNLVASEDFQTKFGLLTMAIGRNVAGQVVYADLAKMPHLLIAGSTGAGKSVCLHSLIVSLLYKNSADDLRFLMIDPKRVELATYNGLPHLFTPVIIEPKKAITALRWATKEMERRYEVLAQKKARDIISYKSLFKNGEEDEMPYIVIIIDELADIMSVYPRELESSIVRLAQMSRAVGIHLIVSTQRPSVEVITGLIKANITSRIAFQVASQIDSRTILDMAGAEKLLGNGDMLFSPGNTTKPYRIQGAFVTDKEVKRVVNYLEDEYRSLSPIDLDLDDKKNKDEFIFNESDNDDSDELYEEARDVIIKTKKASASYLQRRLRIGYSRAARLLDMLEEKGVVGPGEGSKPREVLISSESNIEK